MYRFVKGEGWVYTTKLFDCRYETITDAVGNTVHILDRMPLPGERFCAYYKHEASWYDENGVKFEAIKKHLIHRDVSAFTGWDGSKFSFRACTMIVETL